MLNANIAFAAVCALNFYQVCWILGETPGLAFPAPPAIGQSLRSHPKNKKLRPPEILQYRQKIVYLTNLLSRNPKDIKALAQRANAYLKLQDLKHASLDCEKALALDPKCKDAAEVAYGLVDAYNGDMQEENALHFFNLVIPAYPDEPRLFVERGQLLHGMGRDKEALADQNKAVQMAPNEALPYYARAEVKCTMGNLRGAADDFGISAKYNKTPIHS